MPPPEEPTLDRAEARVQALQENGTDVPAQRLAEVEALVQLLRDKDWTAPPSVPPRALAALVHFADAVDLQGRRKPDSFDLIEVLASDLEHELLGYAEFRALRERLGRKRFRSAEERERRLGDGRRRLRARIQSTGSSRLLGELLGSLQPASFPTRRG
jgi:hypothetical protein